jgi:hypothetical protein
MTDGPLPRGPTRVLLEVCHDLAAAGRAAIAPFAELETCVRAHLPASGHAAGAVEGSFLLVSALRWDDRDRRTRDRWCVGMTAAFACATCGTELRSDAKFRAECGSPTAVSVGPAEHKQGSVLFVDVVHSMDIAAAVGVEPLRENMAELVNRAGAVVQI